jgi:CDP-diacylglycerol--serine O-phosphatidyltransferase
LRLRRNIRLEAIVVIALIGGATFSAPWEMLSLVAIVYLSLIPFSVRSYAKVRRRRRATVPDDEAQTSAMPAP